jgi:Ser/Thr protein kinase RdoA (MazF antagonist)
VTGPVEGFEALSTRAQVLRLRRAAEVALADYPIEVRSIRLLLHGFNTTFRVDALDGRRFALRINVNSIKTEANLDAEVAWLDALARETDVRVPAPQRTRSGGLRTTIAFEPLGRALPAVLMSWLPGRDMDQPDPAGAFELGRLTARLHAHASSWELRARATFPTLERALVDVEDRLGDHPALDPSVRAVFVEALDHVQAHYDALWRAGPVMPIHADLHGGNVKWLRGRIAVFDFDDACLGTPAHDMPISAYYLRDDPPVEEALLAGYASERALPACSHDQFEAIVASRNLILVNDVLRITTAAVRAAAGRYLANSAVKLRAYLDTGTYRHDVPGVQPIDL